MTAQRYFGIGLESVFGGVEDAIIHLDMQGSSLDSPAKPLLQYEGGIGRMPARYSPGAYVSKGGVDAGADMTALALILYLLFGQTDIVTTGVTAVDNEALATGVGETTKTFTLAHGPVIQGSFKFYDTTGVTLHCHDDGFGRVLEDGASGMSGSINYVTKKVKLIGLVASTSYKADYSYGQYEHTLSPVDDDSVVSFSAHVGKDVFEHIFTGCVAKQIQFKVEKEFLTFSLDIEGGADAKAALKDLEDLLISPEMPRAFHDVELKIADYGVALADISAKVKSLTITINTNASTEEGLGLNSRFPQQGVGGMLEITGSMTLQFEDSSYKEDFWGDTDGIGDDDTPTEKAMQITVDSGGASGFGSAVFTIPRVLLEEVKIQPSGRDRLKQEINFQAYYDPETSSIISVLVKNLNRLHDPA
jgi:hypothetical protein